MKSIMKIQASVFSLVALAATSALATTYYVAEDGDDAKDGLSAATAFASFEKGCEALTATNGNTLVVGEGLFSCEKKIVLPPNSTLLGKGPDKTTVVFIGNESRFDVKPASPDARTLVKGFTFTTEGPHACCLYWSADYTTLEDCVFADALASQSAFGIVYLFGRQAQLTRVAIRNCHTWRKTGGFYLNANNGLIDDCLAYDNTIADATPPCGANAYWHDCVLTVRNSTFGHTSATNMPSFFERTAGTGKIEGCVFYSKNAGSPDIEKTGCAVWESAERDARWKDFLKKLKKGSK